MVWSCLALFAFSPPQAEQITALAEKHLAAKQIVGMSVGICVDGRPTYSHGFGWQDRETKMSAGQYTQYRLGSVSKPVTGVAIMREVEAGRLDLDKDVREYVKDWPAEKPGITLRLIMTHTSGLRHYKPGEAEVFKHYPTAASALELFQNDPLIAPTGTKYSYSTHAWTLAAAVLESSTGKSFPRIIAETAGQAVPSLRCEDLSQPIDHHATALYGPVGANPKLYTKREDNSWKYAGGGMVSSAGDLAFFGGRFMAGQIVKPSTVDEMLKPAGGVANANQALAWRVNGDVFSHTGAQQGCAAALFCNRRTKVAVAVMCNTEGGAPGELAQAILGLYNAQAAR